MAIKYREAEELRQTTRQNLAKSVENWTRFLKTAGNTYKYNYSDQLLISAQFPNATAVASFDLWSERFGRRIRTGEKGIGLIDNSGSHPKIRYVFDISQSTANPKIPQPQVWQLRDDYKNAVAFDLSSDTNYSIENAVSDLAENTVDGALKKYVDDIFANQSKSTMLAELDEDTVREQFRELIFDSVKYTAFSRCGLEIDDGDMFRNLYAFSDLPVSDIVGTAVSELSSIVLGQIETRVKNFERSNTNERTVSQDNQRDTVSVVRGGQDILSDNEKGRTDRFDVQARSANLRLSSELDSGRGHKGRGDLGQEKREVPQREQADTAYGDVRQSHTDGSLDRNQSAGRNDVRYDNGESGERVGRDGGTESTRPNGVGTQGEPSTIDSRRTSEDKPDLRITEQSNTPTPKTEDNQSPVFFNTTQGEQLGLFSGEHNATVTNIDELLESIPENAELPTEDYKVENESEVIEEFRRRTDESFHTINGLTASDIEIEVREQLEWAMQENEIAGKIRDVVLYGSRSRGIEDSEKADIDILVEVDGADMKEYALFNFFDELFLEVDGIPVDINPIRPEQTGTLEDFLPTAEEYLEQQKAEKAKKKILSSDGKQEQEELPKTLEQENNQNETFGEQDVVQYTVNFVTQSETYVGGYDSDGHERLDNYSLQQDETSFRIYTDYVSKYDSNLPYGYYDIGTEQAIEEINKLLDGDDVQVQITDKNNNTVSIDDVLSYLKEHTVSEQESLTDKEIAFRDCDIVSILAEAEFNADNVERLGQIFFDDGYTEKNPPSENTYGLGLGEERIYELAEKRKNGEDIAKEFVSELLDKQSSHLSFAVDDNPENSIDCSVELNDNGVKITYGNVVRDVAYADLFNHCMDLFQKDHNNVLQHRQAELTREKNKEIIDSLTVGSQIILPENSWEVTYINGDFSANFSNLDETDKMTDQSYIGRWKEHLLDEAKDQPIIVITPELAQQLKDVVAKTSEYYGMLYDLSDNVDNYNLALEQGEMFINENPSLVNHLNKMRGDILSSDREVAAFGFALAEVGLIEDFLLVEEFENAETVDEEVEQPKEEQAEVKTPLSREELIEKAKSIINDFVNEEYDDTKGADFSDLTKIDVAYTTTEDEKHTIQAYIDLEHLNIVKEVDGHILEKESYDSLEKLVDDLNSLDFSDLTSVSDEQLEKLEQENLTDKDEQPKKINADDIKIGDKFEYKGREYEVTHLTGVYPDDVGVSYIDKASNGLAYEVTSNVDKYTLVNQGKYLGNSRQEEVQPEPIEQTEQTKDFSISDMALGQTKLSERFLNNLSAIRTLKQIESENRQATPSEQETLSKYAGWGGLAKVFEPDNRHYSEVKELLTEDEFANARQSTLTAFYTSPVIIKEMYSKLSEMGFTDGKLLEPSCGVGNFIGMIPENMNVKVSGVELDSLTGRIAQKLYPNADIQVCGFENAKLKDNSFDVAVGNVPFGDFSIYDKKYNKNKLLIHDYFFSKSLDMVKSGGVVAFITSKGTLDKLDKKARTTLAEKAEFLGAVRLPNTAFKSNAGTEVTSDIIFLQKRENPITITPENEPLWLKTAKDENGIEMNAYFVEHPEQICGTMVMESTQYGMASTCQPNLDTKLSEQIRSAMANINGTISTAKVEDEQEIENPLNNVEVPDNLRNGSYFLSNGKAYFFETDNITPVEFPKSRAKQSLERLSGMIAIRDTVRQLLDMQIDEHTTDDEIKAVQSTLSSLYDGFVQKHGRLNDVGNTSVFKKDSSLPLLKSLEKTNQKGEFIGKADIFSKRTVKAQKTISSVENAVDALAVSISEKAGVNLDYMSDLTGMDKGKLIEDLQGLIYRVPNTENYVTADEYLSGDILEKLNAAKVAFDKGDTSMAVNMSALEKAMPERLSASQIDVRLGTTWIKPEYIRDFVYDLLKTPSWNKSQYDPKTFIDVEYSQETGRWNISNKSANKSNALATTTYGTAFKSAYELIEDMLNLRSLTVKDRIEEDGKIKEVTNREKTAIIYSKAELIEQKFEEWIFEDKARRDDLVNTYNETFNSIRPREYDGSHLNFVGMNPEISLRPHQLNAVARCLYGGNTLLAHEVGAGKTFEMIAACMEGKRLGLHNKSLFCVPNHLTEQIGLDFLKLYPNANILVATHKDFEKANRQKLVAKIATGNYDAVIIGHSQLKRIPVSPEKQEEFIRNQLYQLELGIMELKGKGGFQVKELERSKKSLEEKLNNLLNAPKKDEDNITFEQLGIDKLFLDEAHEFKNLFLTTKMSNISGITMSSNTQVTADLYMKTQYLDEITGGKGIVFATGTPISNSMCEMYNMQKYLQSDLLQRKNLFHFDSWATTFGDKVTKLELATEGGYQAKTRFSQFHNLPELMAMFKECADIQTADTLNLPNLPECEIHNVVVQPTEQQKEFVKSLAERATLVHNRAVPPTEDNMLKITTDGKLLGLDQRLINPDLPDEPQTKVNMCVENVFGIWNKTQEQKSTQLIFCDTSTPSGHNSFNLYDDIKKKLVAKGVPENEIEFIHSAKTEDAKEKLFAKVRAGDVRILIGSTKKMGAGTNVQTKLIASHDLDAPYRPSDMEQRRGRMVRQGNENPKVDLYRYCTQDTFDAYLFQMLERKQNFISQVMTSKSPQRKCDDMDEATLSYAEVKALCIGDPRIKEKMELDIDVAKLQLERKAYRDEQYSMEDKIDRLQKRVKGFEISIPKNESDFLYYENNHQPVFDEKGKKVFEGITINGKTYTERKEANEALKNAYINACRQGGGYKDFVSAHCEYKGFNLSVMFDSFSKCYKARLEREGKYYFDLGTDNIGRMDNMLDKLKEMCKDKVSSCAECKKAIEDINENLGKPFPKEQEFLKKTARLAQLNAELDTKGKKDEMGGLESELGDNLTQGNKPKR